MKDTHVYVIERDNEHYQNLKLYSNPQYSEILKMSNRENVTVSSSYIGSGYEDCIDIVRGYNITLRDLTLSSRKNSKARTYITIKGSCKGVNITDIQLVGDTRYPWDISLGDWTIYDADPQRPLMRDVVIRNVNHISGRPVRVLCLYCETPDVDSSVKLIKVPMFLVKIWFALKRLLPGRKHILPLEKWNV